MIRECLYDPNLFKDIGFMARIMGFLGEYTTFSLKKKKCKVLGCNVVSSLQISCSAMSDSLQPHGLQPTRPPSPSQTPRACSNLCPSNQRCHPTILSSVVPFSSHLQSFPASGSFPMSQLFASSGQSIRVSASASVLPINIQH